MPKTIRLAIYFNDELRAVKDLLLPIVIGRSNDVNLTIPHPMVSRRHCLIFEDKSAVRLQDLGSLNGTFIGSERITDYVLQEGSEFQIGSIQFVCCPTDLQKESVLPSDSDIEQSVSILSLSDEPPPLPPSGNENPDVSPGKPTVPGFIKPLPVFSTTPDDGDDGFMAFSEVIDLADLADKETMPPPSPREQE